MDATNTRDVTSELGAKPSESGIRSFTARHGGHMPALDVRNPNSRRYVQPGDIHWELQDWLGYPESATHVEDIWDEMQFITLDDRREDWYFRITREDLRRNHIDLKVFLAPIYETVKTYDIQGLNRRRKEAVSQIKALRRVIDGRVADPKRVSDLFQ